MRIAQIAPLYESVPPQFYGGTERVVSYLTERARAPGPRGYAICQRRFENISQARPMLRCSSPL